MKTDEARVTEQSRSANNHARTSAQVQVCDSVPVVLLFRVIAGFSPSTVAEIDQRECMFRVSHDHIAYGDGAAMSMQCYKKKGNKQVRKAGKQQTRVGKFPERLY